MSGPPGERNGNARLTRQDVQRIRAQHQPYVRGGTQALAREYRVTTQTIRAIVRGEIWGWFD